MLQEMNIENFAIIPKLHISFEKGMTALTGETGAGKSIIIDAMGLLCGGRGSIDYIRRGAKSCFFEGLFLPGKNAELQEKLASFGLEQEDGMLIIQREIFLNGKNTCRVNGRLVNTTTLKEIGSYLVDIHGQNEHQELMHAEKHLSLLDRYGGSANRKLKDRYQSLYEAYRVLKKKVEQRQKNEKEFAQRMDMLAFQAQEISSANLVIGEEETLQEERGKLSNFQRIMDSLTLTRRTLSGEEGFGALDLAGQGMNAMESIADLDEAYEQVASGVSEAYYILEEASATLGTLIDQLEMDPKRLEETENRLDVIRQLKRKYGESVEKILDYYNAISLELAENDLSGSEGESLVSQLNAKVLEVTEAGLALSEFRRQSAAKLERAILVQLKELYLEKAQFEVRFLNDEKDAGEATFREDGLDEVAFYLTTNPGESLKPLAKVASGGEMSRIMLALKTIFSKGKETTSIVFDEVDTGVSGRVAQAIADKIHSVSINSQVLCITHLPQVAAAADTQYLIQKSVKAGRTKTTVNKLDQVQREYEIARMLAGETITDLAVAHAKELLSLADHDK